MDGEKQAPIPPLIKPIAVKPFSFTEVAPLWENLPEPKADRDIKSMEEYDQGFGSILYRTSLPALSAPALLTVNEPHDYAQISLTASTSAPSTVATLRRSLSFSHVGKGLSSTFSSRLWAASISGALYAISRASRITLRLPWRRMATSGSTTSKLAGVQHNRRV